MTRAVFLYENGEFLCMEHNMTTDEAEVFVVRLRAEGLPAFSFEQRFEHRADPDGCEHCHREVSAIFQKGVLGGRYH